VTWPWADAALWDLDKPNLYTVKLAVEGAGLRDEYAQEFGFREFWIAGR
jgi:beta-galactosidase/beta-glucuronidase